MRRGLGREPLYLPPLVEATWAPHGHEPSPLANGKEPLGYLERYTIQQIERRFRTKQAGTVDGGDRDKLNALVKRHKRIKEQFKLVSKYQVEMLQQLLYEKV